MKVALFGDIHANLEAFETVLADAEAQGCDSYVCLGDVVGYNANPSECLEKVRAMGCPVVKGNHDEDAGGDHSLDMMNPIAAEALTWTRDQLTSEQREFLANFSYQFTQVCFHGHTHVPRVFTRGARVQEVQPESIAIEDGMKYFINAGSVGQPRDGDWRASYCIYDMEAKVIYFRRLEYDIETTQKKIIAAGLPEALASRLADGR